MGLDPGETFFPNSVSDLDSAETFQISRNLGLDIDEIVCLLDSQLCCQHSFKTISQHFLPFFLHENPHVQYYTVVLLRSYGLSTAQKTTLLAGSPRPGVQPTLWHEFKAVNREDKRSRR